MHLRASACALALVAGVAASPFAVAVNYKVIDLSAPPGGSNPQVIVFNNARQLLATRVVNGYRRHYIWYCKPALCDTYGMNFWSEVKPLNLLVTEAKAMNDAGEIVGRYQLSPNRWTAFRYANGQMININPPQYPGEEGAAVAINNTGMIVGNVWINGGKSWKTFQHIQGVTTVTQTKNMPVELTGVNDLNHSVGSECVQIQGQPPGSCTTQPFIRYQPGYATNVYLANYGRAYRINNHDQVLMDMGNTVFVGTPGGTRVEVPGCWGPYPFPYAFFPGALNNQGQVSGTSYNTWGYYRDYHACVDSFALPAIPVYSPKLYPTSSYVLNDAGEAAGTLSTGPDAFTTVGIYLAMPMP